MKIDKVAQAFLANDELLRFLTFHLFAVSGVNILVDDLALQIFEVVEAIETEYL